MAEGAEPLKPQVAILLTALLISNSVVAGYRGEKMKEVDDTPVPESESEDRMDLIYDRVHRLLERIQEIEKRVANLETQRVANENNQDDPEWY